MDIKNIERFKDAPNKTCWQYYIRTQNLEKDLLQCKLTLFETQRLRVHDFEMDYESKEKVFQEATDFIKNNEWLGSMSQNPTHIFTARYKGILAGIVIMDVPNNFSKLLGEDTKKIERLISRGACISWSPKNLGSSLIMFAIKWMIRNTPYRLFTAYSDPDCYERGIIYQACNFYYLGQKYGVDKKYILPSGKYVSDRYFRMRSVYKKLAIMNCIDWYDEYNTGNVVHWHKMPEGIPEKIKQLSKDYMDSCSYENSVPKRKYAYVLGKDNRETKYLRKQFEQINKKIIKPYEKDYFVK